MDFVKLTIATALMIATNSLLGGAIANFEGTFDKRKMLQGVKNGAVFLAVVSAVYWVGALLPAMVFEIGDFSGSAQGILESVLTMAVALYLGKTINNLVYFIGLKPSEMKAPTIADQNEKG